MQRKFKITVDGRQYDVTVEESSEVSSMPHSPPGAPYMDAASTSHRRYPEAPTLSPGAAPPTRGPAEAGAVVCTLGGRVDSVLVTAGQQVSAGDHLVVIEAMKMKTPIAAPRAGKVGAILVKAGESVETGQVLVELTLA
jgi:biotin carboxyl carrier protein